MKIVIDVHKSVAENAAFYYERSKSSKKKIIGAEEIIKKQKEQLMNIEKANEKLEGKKKIIREFKWYEKFRWFISSENVLVIMGRDATTNDMIVRKYMEKEDLVFHTETPGSPFTLIKEKCTEKTIEEAASATASFSKAWGAGVTTTEVYYVKGEQVKKELGIPKGTFMIYGKKLGYFSPEISLAVGILEDGKVMCAPLEAVKKNCKTVIKIAPGDVKKSDMAKRIKYLLEQGTNFSLDLDQIMQVLPPGDCRILK